ASTRSTGWMMRAPSDRSTSRASSRSRPSGTPSGCSGAGAPRAEEAHMATPSKPARVPPRWFVGTARHAHRAIHQLTGGRRGLWRYTPGGRWGALVLHSTGRRSGKVRSAILGYVEDGENLAVLAMNGWGQPEPAWWLNLQAHPDAIVELKGGER